MATRKPNSDKPKAVKPPKSPRTSPKARAKAPVKEAPRKGLLYLGRDEYKATIDELVAQGLERKEAVMTLRIGIRQANGRPVPAELLAQCVNDPFIAFDQPALAA